MKYPAVAAALNIIPGLGYLYIGRRKVFGTLLVIGFVIHFSTMIVSEYYIDTYGFKGQPLPEGMGELFTTPILFAYALSIAAFMYDAHSLAVYSNRVGKKKVRKK